MDNVGVAGEDGGARTRGTWVRGGRPVCVTDCGPAVGFLDYAVVDVDGGVILRTYERVAVGLPSAENVEASSEIRDTVACPA